MGAPMEGTAQLMADGIRNGGIQFGGLRSCLSNIRCYKNFKMLAGFEII